MTVIVPTVGRVVWFYEDSSQKEPKAAIVAMVHTPQEINLMVVEMDGTTTAALSVVLVQEGEDIPAQPGSYAMWMPYQLGQAKNSGQLIPPNSTR